MTVLLSPFSIAKLCTLVVLGLLLSSCSGTYTFDSNLKADGAKEYFSASKVAIYNSEEEFKTAYQFVSAVEGDDCQLAPHLAAPDPVIARTKARQLAYSKKANAVIFTGCVEVENQFCTAQIVCYAKAYQISSHEYEPETETETEQ